MVTSSTSLISDFEKKPVRVPTLESTADLDTSQLEDMIQDKMELEQVLEYVQHEINASRKASSLVPHKGSVEQVTEALEGLVSFWEEYEGGPRAIGEQALSDFLDKYQDDENYHALYLDSYQAVLDQILDDVETSERLEIEKELKVKFRFHHTSKATQLERMLHENEYMYRKNSVENAVKRIVIQVKAGRKATTKTNSGNDIEDIARIALELLPPLCPDSKTLHELEDLMA